MINAPVDCERLLPIQVLALCVYPLGIVRGWRGIAYYVLFFWLLSQFMILPKVIDNALGGEKWRWYCLVNELYIIASLLVLGWIASLFAR
jgi:hypothetical protein